jgi:hypothetical protein
MMTFSLAAPFPKMKPPIMTSLPVWKAAGGDVGQF